LHQAIEAAPRLRHRLVEGEMLVFNNRTMLHGREAFSLPGGGHKRWLRGCYVNIDDFANKYNLLRRRHTDLKGDGRSTAASVPVGNQDWACGRTFGLP
jgi:hypothetical protein